MQKSNQAKRDNEFFHKENSSIPVTIITGFLGAGKTTLLNKILENQKGLKTAVLVNEFGEIGIDNNLIIKTSEEMVELSNGCICCSINGELLEAVNKILEKNNSIEYIIVETTGLADPLPVAMTFLGSELREKTRLDSIITLIDAENLNDDILESKIARSQIIYSDILIINKCDIVSNERLIEVEAALTKVKSNPRILRSVNANIPLKLLLSVGLFETDLINTNNSSNDHSKCDHENEHCHHEHEEDNSNINDADKVQLDIEGYNSISFESDSPFSLRKFQNFLDNQLSKDVFRAKGILWFDESERRHLFHLAGKRFSIEDSEWQGSKKNQIVLIGKKIKSQEIKQQLKSCISLESGKDFS